MLFIEINDCFENFFITDEDFMLDSLHTNKKTDVKTINPIKPNQ